MKENKFWKIGFLLLFAALLGAVAYFAYSYGKNKTSSTGMPNPASVYCEKEGGRVQIQTAQDGSQSGRCIFSDGSSCDEWAFYRGECQKGQVKESGQSDADLIKQAVYKKFNSDETKLRVTISEIEGDYAKGGIVESTSEVGGGYFIAAKVSGNWVIVYDGQANPSCSQIAPYNFPKEIVPECLDSKGAVVTR